MSQPLPALTDDLAILEERLRRERAPQRQPRLPLLVLLKARPVTSRGQAAAHLALHRNTGAAWPRRSRDGGPEALGTDKEVGAPAGPKTLPPPGFAQRKRRLAPPTGLARSLDLRRGLRAECGLDGPDKTLHGLGHSRRKAKRKRPRPSQAKSTSPQRRTCSNSARAAWAPSRPEAGPRRPHPYGPSARMTRAWAGPCRARGGGRARWARPCMHSTGSRPPGSPHGRGLLVGGAAPRGGLLDELAAAVWPAL
jgi:hypothetical protein